MYLHCPNFGRILIIVINCADEYYSSPKRNNEQNFPYGF